jgi:fatty acid desaturase
MTTQTLPDPAAAATEPEAGAPMWTLAGRRYRPFSFQPEVMREIARLRPDDARPVLWIAMNWSVIVAAALATVWISWWLYPLAVLLIAAQQRGLTTIAHDAAHRTLARTKAWNYALGILFAAYPLFQKHWAYRVSHVHLHHPHLGDPTRDPDLKFFLGAGAYDVCDPKTYVWRIIWRPILGGATVAYLKYLFLNRFRVRRDDDQQPDRTGLLIDGVGFWAFWAAVVAIGLGTGTLLEIALFWVVPYLTAFQILGWFIELAEHTPMCESETHNVYLTRNRKGNWLEWLLFGVNYDEYHLEHHLSPGVPFYRLPDAQHIRMRDPAYARVAATWGGLFVAGPQGQPSVIRQLVERNRRLWEAGEAGRTGRDAVAALVPRPADAAA